MTENDFDNRIRLLIAILLNTGITISEAAAGIITGSFALLSDAGHNLSDVLSLILGYFGASFSQKKPTKQRTFGYRRFEVITSLINAIFLLFVGTYILFESYNRYKNPSPIEPTWVILVASIALIGNVGSIFLLNKGEKSLNIRAVLLHLVLDSIASVGVVISGLIIYFYEFYLIDVFISVIISLFIFYSAKDVLKEVYNIMMQGTPVGIEFNEVKDFLEDFEEVNSIHDLHIWSLSSKEVVLSCHICSSISEIDRTKLIKKIEKALMEEFGFQHITIQIEKNKVCETGNHSPSDLV